MPLLWTGVGFGLMGVINPLLQHRVSWPWFIVSQFVFGVVAATVVVRSEKIFIPPAGPGPGVGAEYLTRTREGAASSGIAREAGGRDGPPPWAVSVSPLPPLGRAP